MINVITFKSFSTYLVIQALLNLESIGRKLQEPEAQKNNS